MYFVDRRDNEVFTQIVLALLNEALHLKEKKIEINTSLLLAFWHLTDQAFSSLLVLTQKHWNIHLD